MTINELDVNGDTVARTDQIKFLGGYLDANLTLRNTSILSAGQHLQIGIKLNQ